MRRMVLSGGACPSFFDAFCFAYGVDKAPLMPPENNGRISFRVSEYNPISGDSTEIESVTTSASTYSPNLGEPRVVWNLHDLSSYMQEIEANGLTPILSWRRGVDVTQTPPLSTTDEIQAYLVIDKECPGLMRTLNNIAESRIAEARGVPVEFDRIEHLFYQIRYECLTAISSFLGIRQSEIYVNATGCKIVEWLNEFNYRLHNADVISDGYYIGPNMSGYYSIPKSVNKRSIAIFKGK